MDNIKNKPEVSNLLSKKHDREQKYMEDIFTTVTMKRHKKEQDIKRKEREVREQAVMKQDKERERQYQKQQTKDEIVVMNKKRTQSLKVKFQNMDKGVKEVRESINEYKQSLKEFNMFKHIESTENIQRLQRGRSAYRDKLAEKLIQKGQRAMQISQKKNQVSKMAYHNQVNFRQQLTTAQTVFKELEKQHKIDMEQKIVIKKLKEEEED